MKRLRNNFETINFHNIQNIMSSPRTSDASDASGSDSASACSTQLKKKFIDVFQSKKSLLEISEIRKRFNSYEKFSDHRVYGESIVWYDVGAMLFLIYISKSYPQYISIPMDEREIVNSFDNKEKEHLEWVKFVDNQIDDDESPKFHIYVKDGKFIFDKNILKVKDENKIQIFMVSHSFSGCSGHMGCLFVFDNKAYYYDSNGMKDNDEKDYYDKFGVNLTNILKEYEIEYCPYVWRRGIQSIQNSEESKYNLDITGMCCAWSYLMIELKLLNPSLTVEEIENKIKIKYRNRLTRYVVSYQQMIHPILLQLSKEIYETK